MCVVGGVVLMHLPIYNSVSSFLMGLFNFFCVCVNIIHDPQEIRVVAILD